MSPRASARSLRGQDVIAAAEHRKKLMGMAMAATRPLKAEKWGMICAKLGEVYGESPNAYMR